MDDFIEQEFFYVAAQPMDGSQPRLENAVCGWMFVSKEGAEAAHDALLRGHCIGYGIYRAVARISVKPEAKAGA